MGFAGPDDPAIHRSLEAARKKGIVLVAAAGNADAKSPPLYPAADPNVIAISATDADDRLFEQSNRGRHITVAAPGAQILVAIPDNGYEMSSGTSYSAAEVSGIVALMLQRTPNLTPPRILDREAPTRCSARVSPMPMARSLQTLRLWPLQAGGRLSASAPASAEKSPRHEQYISCGG
jgi:subtilisin family serine protease